MIENILLRKQNKAANKDISVQYLMSNSFGQNQYCYGSNCYTIINYLSQLSNYKTLQFWQDLRYDPDKNYKKWQQRIEIQPNKNSLAYKETNNNLPWYQFNYNNNDNPSNIVFVIKQDNFVKEAKSVLNSGIVIAANIQVEALDFQFSFYNGRSVLSKQFKHGLTNHQIVIVGYTIKDNQECWIVLNSHGNNWGDNGYGYIRMGYNDYNLEQIGYYIISDSDIYKLNDKQYNTQQIRKQISKSDKLELQQIQNPGVDLIENNGITNYYNKIITKYICIIVILSLATLLTLIFGLFIYIQRRKQKSDYEINN